MTDRRQDLRQNTVLWWLMQGGLVVAFIVPMMLLFYGALSALNMFPGVQVSVRVAVIWGGVVAFVASVAAAIGVPLLWSRFVTPHQDESERRRYRAISNNDDTLPASAWADEDEE